MVTRPVLNLEPDRDSSPSSLSWTLLYLAFRSSTTTNSTLGLQFKLHFCGVKISLPRLSSFRRVLRVINGIERLFHIYKTSFETESSWVIMSLSQVEWRSYLDDILDEHMRLHVVVDSREYISAEVERVGNNLCRELTCTHPFNSSAVRRGTPHDFRILF